MASLEDVELWMDEELFLDVYVPELKQWLVAEVTEVNRGKRELHIEYHSFSRPSEWLNVDEHCHRFAELSTHTGQNNGRDESGPAAASVSYTDSHDTQVQQWLSAVADTVQEQYGSSKSPPITLATACELFVQRWLAAGPDDDITESSVSVPLYDPLTRCRLNLPARGLNCTHGAVFDVRSHIEHNTGKPEWRCSICKSIATVFDIQIDQFVLAILLSNKQSSSTSVPALDHQQLPAIVKQQLNSGLSEDIEHRYVVVNQDSTFFIKGGDDNDSGGSSSKQRNGTTSACKQSASASRASVDVDMADEEQKSADSSLVRQEVIDLTTDEYDNAEWMEPYMKKIAIKQEKASARKQSVTDSLTGTHQWPAASSTSASSSSSSQSSNLSPTTIRHHPYAPPPPTNGQPTSIYTPPAMIKQREAAGVAAARAQAQHFAININTANKSQLMKLPGVGAKSADKILAHRAATLAQRRQRDPNVAYAYDTPLAILGIDGLSYTLLDQIRWLITI